MVVLEALLRGCMWWEQRRQGGATPWFRESGVGGLWCSSQSRGRTQASLGSLRLGRSLPRALDPWSDLFFCLLSEPVWLLLAPVVPGADLGWFSLSLGPHSGLDPQLPVFPTPP